MALTDAQKAKLIKLGQLEKFKQLSDAQYQNQAIELTGIQAETVEGALVELLGKIGASDVSFEKLVTPNTGKSATYRFTKGSGAGATTMDIDIEKEEVRAIVGFVTITESGGKYYDGATEVTSADGVTGAGVYLKSQELKDGTATGVVKYANASAVIEYITVGTQTGKPVQLTIDANHQITADIPEKAIAKSHLAQGVQDSLGLADTALQSHQDISGKADKVASATSGNFAGLDANGNLTDSGKKASDFQAAGNYKTTQSAVSDPSADGTGITFIDSVSQDTNGVITPHKKTVQSASASTSGVGGQAGLMSAADKEKLDDIAYASDSDIEALFA